MSDEVHSSSWALLLNIKSPSLVSRGLKREENYFYYELHSKSLTLGRVKVNFLLLSLTRDFLAEESDSIRWPESMDSLSRHAEIDFVHCRRDSTNYKQVRLVLAASAVRSAR